MCPPKPPKPKALPKVSTKLPPPPPPPAPTAKRVEESEQRRSAEKRRIKSRRSGTSALRIDLAAPSNTGVNLPQ